MPWFFRAFRTASTAFRVPSKAAFGVGAKRMTAKSTSARSGSVRRRCDPYTFTPTGRSIDWFTYIADALGFLPCQSLRFWSPISLEHRLSSLERDRQTVAVYPERRSGFVRRAKLVGHEDVAVHAVGHSHDLGLASREDDVRKSAIGKEFHAHWLVVYAAHPLAHKTGWGGSRLAEHERNVPRRSRGLMRVARDMSRA